MYRAKAQGILAALAALRGGPRAWPNNGKPAEVRDLPFARMIVAKPIRPALCQSGRDMPSLSELGKYLIQGFDVRTGRLVFRGRIPRVLQGRKPRPRPRGLRDFGRRDGPSEGGLTRLENRIDRDAGNGRQRCGRRPILRDQCGSRRGRRFRRTAWFRRCRGRKNGKGGRGDRQTVQNARRSHRRGTLTGRCAPRRGRR